MRSTLPTSHGFSPLNSQINSPLPKAAKTAYVTNFEFVGTIDNAPYLCVPAAIAWRENLGGEDVIRKYCWTLAREGAKLVARELGTEVLENSTNTLGRCCLSMVRLPISVTTVQQHAAKLGIEASEVGGAVRDWMSKTMIDDYGTFMQSLFYGGAWWVRLSGQVYLEMRDMEYAARTLREICGRVERGEWVGKGSKL